jgi:uncharacterized protein YaiL (DUF2058 family)
VSSLQDQLLKAGLADKKKLAKAKKAKQKAENLQQRNPQQAADTSRELAQQALAEKARRSRELARGQNAAAEHKAVMAQVRQLIELNRLSRQGAEVPYNFVDGKQIKKLYVSNKMQSQLAGGILAIARLDAGYEVIPAAVADKIRQRAEESIVLQNAVEDTAEASGDDPYADYQVPDDLMW